MAASKETSRFFPVLLAGVFGLSFLLLWFLHQSPKHHQYEFQIDRVDFVSSAGIRATELALPHTWHTAGKGAALGRYIAHIDLTQAPMEVWAVYFPRVSGRLLVHVNQQMISADDILEDDRYRFDNRPHLLLIPASLMQAGRNEIWLDVAADMPIQGDLSTFYLGSAERLVPRFQLHQFLKHRVSQFIVVLLLLMATLMTVLWRLRPGESIYLWYALASLAWAVHGLDRVVTVLPVSALLWDWLMVTSLLWLPVLCSLFIHRYLNLSYPARERHSIRLLVVVSLVLLLLHHDAFYRAIPWANNLTLAFGLYPVTLLAWFTWHRRSVDLLYLLLAGLFMVVLGVHDAWVVNNWLEQHQGFLLHFSVPVVLTVFTTILLRRFVEALTLSENLSRELEQRVQSKHDELEENYIQLRVLERERVLALERERLTRDMHDGIGGHLISLMAQVEARGAATELVLQGLREALEDLRLMIDSMEEVDGDLLAILGMFRGRIEPRLEQTDIELQWQVTDLPPLSELGPEKALHILRILQEAVSNSLRHANASRIVLSTGRRTLSTGQYGVYVCVADNGHGFDLNADNGNGRGIRNLQRRAELVGGELEIHSTGDGTRLSLILPL